ncbi:MAG: putative toxin-antitoxin system toxin component, PIN family [Prosthecobacter sp.]|nr:putative toxin-antitoxin system toxin component, PIN family [Prosthecobacter sp.]
MIVCIDTNALVEMLGRNHPSRQILREWQRGKFVWAVSNEILAEYEEIIVPRIGPARWEKFLDALELTSRLHRNLELVQPDFRFGVISEDRDDNKFCDCAITANADKIITADHHFDVLNTQTYRPRPMTTKEFLARHFDELGRFTP